MANTQIDSDLKLINQTKINKANLIDLIIFILIVLILVNNESMHWLIRILCMLVYPAIVLPLLIALGGTPGQRLSGIIVRKNDDSSRFPSIFNAYKRLIYITLNKWLGFIIKDKKSSTEFDIKSNTVLLDITSEMDLETRAKYNKQKSKINFVIAAITYVAWVIWLGNYWFLVGLVIIFDIYISKKVNWTPWKKRKGANHWLVEWLDALIFAVVAVTIINIFLFQNYKIPTGSMEKSLLIGDHLYVSKIAYGPRIPNTPLSIPFMQHTIPGTLSKSYVEWINWPYKRLKGLTVIKRDDPVVFNFPAGDTVCIEWQTVSYYYIVNEEADRMKLLDQYANVPLKSKDEYYHEARNKVWNKYNMVVRPVDKRDNYIKRCVGIPGDTLRVIDGVVYVNGGKQKQIEGIQYMYLVETGGRQLNNRKLEQLGISKTDIRWSPDMNYLQVTLTENMAKELAKNALVLNINRFIQSKEYIDNKMFPFDPRYPWNLDQYGPLYIPKKGTTIKLTLDNLPLYERIIDYYEENDFRVKDSTIYINGKPADSYTFKMDYYWMMGDNRHSSLDSRYWGFVPEDHIIGKPRFVWLSLDKDKHFPMNVRMNRMFMTIK